MDNLLSMVILSYKNGEMLEETIDSILSQDYPAIEIIICDDATPDFNRDYYSQYIEAHKKRNIVNYNIIINNKNLGTVKNLNNGIKASHGNYIKAIAGDDCISSGNVISKQVQYLIEHPDLYLVVGNSVQCDRKMAPVAESGFMLNDSEQAILRNNNKLIRYITRINQNALATQAICFRKSFFEKFGLYDEGFVLVEDLPMAVRIVENHVGFGYINYPCVNHRGSVGVSTSSNALDKRRISYYRDLERYFRITLMPIKNNVGSIYVQMRQKVAEFRVKYCMMTKPTFINKFKMSLQYAVPLAYYAITKSKRFFRYLRK